MPCSLRKLNVLRFIALISYVLTIENAYRASSYKNNVRIVFQYLCTFRYILLRFCFVITLNSKRCLFIVTQIICLYIL